MNRDTRDRRDPQRLGEAVLRLRTKGRGKLSRLYDQNHAAMLAVPDYTGEGEGIGAEQVAAYAAEFPEGLPSTDDIDPGGE
jgi:hypothetical protein